VVIVEDSEDARASLQRILDHEGHTVHTTADGSSGFDAIGVRRTPDEAAAGGQAASEREPHAGRAAR